MREATLSALKAGVILLLASGAIPARALAADTRLIIDEGFESGRLAFRPSGNSPEVIQVPDARAGRYVMKSELNESSKDPMRTEVEVLSGGRTVNFDVGKEYWVGISIKLGKEFDDATNLQDQGMVLQWHYRDWLHREVRDAQPLLLRYQDHKVHVHNEVLQEFMASTPPAYGEWVDWVIHVKFDDRDGIIQVWRNGHQVVDWRGDNHQKEKSEGAYLKFGLYSAQYKSNPPGIGFKRCVYHDELRVAGADGSYELVAPRNDKKPAPLPTR
jgi:hypothetical protein